MILNVLCGDVLVDKVSPPVELIYAEEDNIQGTCLYYERNLVKI